MPSKITIHKAVLVQVAYDIYTLSAKRDGVVMQLIKGTSYGITSNSVKACPPLKKSIEYFSAVAHGRSAIYLTGGSEIGEMDREPVRLKTFYKYSLGEQMWYKGHREMN